MNDTIKYEAQPGSTIDTCQAEAHAMACETSKEVCFDFNGHKLCSQPGTDSEIERVAMRKVIGLPAMNPPLHPETAKDALEKWDRNESMFTIEMGGLGPGYEQAIQVLVFELIRDNISVAIPEDSEQQKVLYRDFGDSTISRIDEKMGGYSGAMVGAAKQIAFRALRDGWAKTIESAPTDRHIQVSKSFPTLT